MTTRISSAGNSATLAGFTLIELLVALTILALVASVTAPALGRALDRARLHASTRTLVQALRQTRYKAQSTYIEAAFTVDVAAGNLAASGHVGDLPLPADASLTLLTADEEQIDSTTGSIRFFPDGSSTGGNIVLAHAGVERRIRVDWLTGRISIEP